MYIKIRNMYLQYAKNMQSSFSFCRILSNFRHKSRVGGRRTLHCVTLFVKTRMFISSSDNLYEEILILCPRFYVGRERILLSVGKLTSFEKRNGVMKKGRHAFMKQISSVSKLGLTVSTQVAMQPLSTWSPRGVCA